MRPAIDPRVQRFLEIHSVSERDAVEADVADHRDQTPAERWQVLVTLCRTLSWWQSRPQEERERMLDSRDLPHPSYLEIVRRLRSP